MGYRLVLRVFRNRRAQESRKEVSEPVRREDVEGRDVVGHSEDTKGYRKSCGRSRGMDAERNSYFAAGSEKVAVTAEPVLAEAKEG